MSKEEWRTDFHARMATSNIVHFYNKVRRHFFCWHSDCSEDEAIACMAFCEPPDVVIVAAQCTALASFPSCSLKLAQQAPPHLKMPKHSWTLHTAITYLPSVTTGNRDIDYCESECEPRLTK